MAVIGGPQLTCDFACSCRMPSVTLRLMADPYIDKYETLLYGRFAAGQILALLIGLDPDLDGALQVMSARVTAATTAMEDALKKAGDLEIVTYAAAGSAPGDPVAEARRVLRQLIAYVSSRDNGEAILADVLLGENMGTVLKRRPVKLAGAIATAISAVHKHQASLPEHQDWTAKLNAAQTALDALNESVRKARTSRRAMTPEIAAARDAWLVTYTSAKDIVTGVLRGKHKLSMLPEVFDDLAEVHRVPGVSDDPVAVPSEATTPEPNVPA